MTMVRGRQKFLIFLLLVFALAAFAYVRREVFFQQAKGMIEQDLERRLQCDFSIEKLKPGIFKGAILENLNFAFPKLCGLDLEMRVARAVIDYNLWAIPAFNEAQLVSKREFAGEDVVIILEGACISADGFTLLNNLEGKLRLNQNGIMLQEMHAALGANQQQVLTFSGELSQQQLTLEAKLEHLRTEKFDLLTNCSLNLNQKIDLQDKDQKISGTLKTYGSVLNNHPAPELNSSFEVRKEELRILACSLGDNYDLRGIVDLAPGFNADLSLNIHQAAPDRLICDFSLSDKVNFAGLVNGLIKITGPLRQPKIDGCLEVKRGYIGDLDFASADINLKGRYPRILITDSRIRREEGSFLMEGELDLSGLGPNAFNINVEPDKGLLWQGWDITRSRKDQVHMSKSIADDVRVTFDAFMEEEPFGFQDDYKNEFGLEYRIFGDKLLKLKLRQDEEILGVEKRVKF